MADLAKDDGARSEERENGNVDLFELEFRASSGPVSKNPFNLKVVGKMCENLTEDGGVKKMLVKRGSGPLVTEHASVSIRYWAYTETGLGPYEFSRRPKTVDVGMSTFRGLTIALSSMRRGEKADFYISPAYAFGKLGCPPSVPPNSTCLYTIEMLDYDEIGGAEEYYERSKEEKMDASFAIYASVAHLKQKEARVYFKAGKIFKAKRTYEDVANRLKNYDEEDNEEWQKLVVSANSNAALCCLKVNKREHCVAYADIALKYDPKSIKALYIKGKALRAQGNIDGALRCLMEAKQINGRCLDVSRELHRLERRIEAAKHIGNQKGVFLWRESEVLGTRTPTFPATQERRVEGQLKLELDETQLMHPDFITLFGDVLKKMLLEDNVKNKLVFSTENFSSEELLGMKAMAQKVGLVARSSESRLFNYLKITML